MTDRLSDIGAHIESVQQLGAVVNAMRGIAAARARQARTQLDAVDSYAATIAAAIGRVMAIRQAAIEPGGEPKRRAIVLFLAEQGFAGAFSDRVLEAVGADLAKSDLFVVGTRGGAIAAEKGLSVTWRIAMPSHSPGIPKTADRIADALYAGIASGALDRVEAVFSRSRESGGVEIARLPLLPLDPAAFPTPPNTVSPLVDRSPEVLLRDLTGDYLHARLCAAALHAFAAENVARMEAMASARNQIERQLSTLRATQRLVRQEAITAEIIELAAGETASRRRKPLSRTQPRTNRA